MPIKSDALCPQTRLLPSHHPRITFPQRSSHPELNLPGAEGVGRTRGSSGSIRSRLFLGSRRRPGPSAEKRQQRCVTAAVQRRSEMKKESNHAPWMLIALLRS